MGVDSYEPESKVGNVSFLGLAVRAAKGAPYLRAVLLGDRTQGVLDRFEFAPTAADDLPEQILSLADGLAGHLAVLGEPPTRVVLRQGDERQGHGTGVRIARTRAEGAVLYVARHVCDDVQVMNGPAIGRACGSDKAAVEQEAARLVPEPWVVAASAALAARGG